MATVTYYELQQEFLRLIGGVQSFSPTPDGQDCRMITETCQKRTMVTGISFYDCFTATVQLWKDQPGMLPFIHRYSVYPR